ncbi:MAG TPA: DUF1697 domain-containing protein [Solirubrobacteraceae bacterium]|nr:DUF1697 domain-containing protein [Solirubrobacteraceae bacterium]
MATQIALLRGINLGAHHRVPMAELRAHLTEAGYGDVRTLLQSGNVVLDADERPERLAASLERELADRFDVRSPVVVRTAEQLAAVVALDPLREHVDQDKLYQVSFLSAEPDRATLERLAAADFAPERYVHAGREIYAWHPAGIQRSPLARLLSDKSLGVVATARNWSTTVKLLELAQAHENDG